MSGVPAVVCLFASLATIAQAQSPPDLSGRWLLVEATGEIDGWDVADAVTLQPVAVDTTAAGASRRSFLRELRIERTTRGAIRVETLRFGQGGAVGGIAGGTPMSEPQSQWAVRWMGERLLIWTSTTSRTSGGGERESERAQEWSLDAFGRLVMAVRTRDPGQASRRGRLLYRRADRP